MRSHHLVAGNYVCRLRCTVQRVRKAPYTDPVASCGYEVQTHTPELCFPARSDVDHYQMLPAHQQTTVYSFSHTGATDQLTDPNRQGDTTSLACRCRSGR